MERRRDVVEMYNLNERTDAVKNEEKKRMMKPSFTGRFLRH